jgi:hypothetical protein
MDAAARARAEYGATNTQERPTLSVMLGEEAYDQDGVDRSLIRWMLGLTPAERLNHVQGTSDLVSLVRRVPDGNR